MFKKKESTTGKYERVEPRLACMISALIHSSSHINQSQREKRLDKKQGSTAVVTGKGIGKGEWQIQRQTN